MFYNQFLLSLFFGVILIAFIHNTNAQKDGIIFPISSEFDLKKSFSSNSVHIFGKLQQEPRITMSTEKMKSWQINGYTEKLNLQLVNDAEKPEIKQSTDLLVKIFATSVNPIDTMMSQGYGAVVINKLRGNIFASEFPLTLGRDFVGLVEKVHPSNKNFKVGDNVWGIVPVPHRGCHSEYIVIDQCFVTLKPENLDDLNAAAVVYAGMTAYGGLKGYLNGRGAGKKVLVLGASGGVGLLAVQILIHEGYEVLATGATDSMEMIRNLGVSKAIDYKAAESDEILVNESPYHLILDCAGKTEAYANQLPWKFETYISYNSPLLINFDAYGIIIGGLLNVNEVLCVKILSLFKWRTVKWGFVSTEQAGLQYLKKLVEENKLSMILDSTYKFDTTPDAYQKVMNGHLRGKVVIDFTK